MELNWRIAVGSLLSALLHFALPLLQTTSTTSGAPQSSPQSAFQSTPLSTSQNIPQSTTISGKTSSMNASLTAAQSGHMLSDFTQFITTQQLQRSVPGLDVVSHVFTYFGVDILGVVSIVFLAFGIAKFFKHVAASVSKFLFCWVASSLTISPKERVHEEVLQWVSKNVVDEKSWFRIAARSLTVVTAKPWDDIITKFHGVKEIDDRSPSVKYVPAISASMWFFHGWYPIILRREKTPDPVLSPDQAWMVWQAERKSGEETVKDTIILYTFWLNAEPLKRFMDACRESTLITKSSVTTFRKDAVGKWGPQQVRPTRPLETVDIDEEKKNELVEDIRLYLRPGSRRWYARRGIPYRRGYLFYGPPGTGKTSMSLALAGFFGLELHIINLQAYTLAENTLASLFEKLPPKCVVLLEDIDSAGLKRENMSQSENEEDAQVKPATKPSRQIGRTSQEGRMLKRVEEELAKKNDLALQPITLSTFLNTIDGITSQEGRILIMTTNNPETLDKALIRPGRVDLQVYFGPVSIQIAKRIFTRMYQREADEQDDSEGLVVGEALHDLPGKGVVSSSAPSTPRSATFHINTSAPSYHTDELREMAEVFASMIPPDKFTPAEIQGYLLSKMTSPVAALQDIDAWVAMTLKSKEGGENAFEGAEFTTGVDNGAAGPSTSHARPSGLFVDEVIPSYDDGYASMSSGSSSGTQTPRQRKAQPATAHAHDDVKPPSSSSVSSSPSPSSSATAAAAASAKAAHGGNSPRPHADGAFYTPKGAEGSLEELRYRKGIDAYFKSSKGKSVDRGVP